ncbi:MAG: histidine phosphatase family protein [Myxococcota bacterium]
MFTALLWSACREPPLVSTPSAVATATPPLPEPAVVFVVRHGEKGVDSILTEEGVARAELLARMLTEVELVGVHSTDTERTLGTAQPTAQDHGLSVGLYEETGALVDALVAVGGAHLVVGHSDTVPSIVEHLDPDTDATPIGSEEYDRLYLVVRTPVGATTTLLRFGAASEVPFSR